MWVWNIFFIFWVFIITIFLATLMLIFIHRIFLSLLQLNLSAWPIFFTYGRGMVSLSHLLIFFLFMHTRSVLLSLYHRLIAYHTYSMGIDIIFADATEHDLGTTEMCVICHDPLSSAKKLHCGHMFHGNCIRQWTQYKLLCPICRTCFCKSCTAKTEGRNIDQLSFLRRTIAWISWRFSSSPCASFLTAPARGSNLEQNEVFWVESYLWAI